MPAAIHQQFEDTLERFEADYSLLYLVLIVLGVFYVVIMWILASSNNDRVTQLNYSKQSAIPTDPSISTKTGRKRMTAGHVDEDPMIRDGGFLEIEKSR